MRVDEASLELAAYPDLVVGEVLTLCHVIDKLIDIGVMDYLEGDEQYFADIYTKLFMALEPYLTGEDENVSEG